MSNFVIRCSQGQPAVILPKLINIGRSIVTNEAIFDVFTIRMFIYIYIYNFVLGNFDEISYLYPVTVVEID